MFDRVHDLLQYVKIGTTQLLVRFKKKQSNIGLCACRDDVSGGTRIAHMGDNPLPLPFRPIPSSFHPLPFHSSIPFPSLAPPYHFLPSNPAMGCGQCCAKYFQKVFQVRNTDTYALYKCTFTYLLTNLQNSSVKVFKLQI